MKESGTKHAVGCKETMRHAGVKARLPGKERNGIAHIPNTHSVLSSENSN